MNAGSNITRIARSVEVDPSRALPQNVDGQPEPALASAGALTLDPGDYRSGPAPGSAPLVPLSPSRPADDAQVSPHALAPTRSTQSKLLPEAVASKVLLYCLTPGEAMSLARESQELRRAVATDALVTMAREISSSSNPVPSASQSDDEALHRLRNPDTAALRAALGIAD